MKEKELRNEGLADLAHKVEKDHEVQMARAELYKIGKYAIKLHEMLKGVSEQEGLEGWVQSKITKAGDYLSSVYHHMDYEQKFEQVQTEAKAKPDFLDMDKDGDKKEPMKKAVKDKEAKKDKKESIDYKDQLAEQLGQVLSKKKTERSLTKGEEKKKEKFVKGMKKAKGDFKDRYGDDAEAVMYATATKMAKKESKDQIKKAFSKTMPSKVTGYYQIIDFWKEHTQMWGKKPEEVKYEIADWMVDELKPDNTPEREELTKRAWAIVDDVIKNNDEDMTFDDMIDKLSTNESGIMYRAGVKKYGKAGMKAIQSAAGKGASHQEIGKIKDKHLKDEVGETATVGATAAGNIATVANPHIANSKAKPKKQKPTDNALDNKSHGLFGQPLKRLNNSKEVTMDKDTELRENLADMASKVEQDHEVQMARAQLYKIAKYSIKMHEMLKNVSEQEGLEGWVQSKITKAADYMGAVYHNMDYEQKFEEVSESADCGCDTHETHSKCKDDCDCDPVTEGKAKNPKQQAAIAIAKKKDGYKESLADKLDAKISEKSKGLYYNVNKRKKAGTSRKKGHPKAPTKQDWENAAKTAKESSIEEKQKGVDGKACWDGYKRMGTKKKGGKTVDNCVKM